MHVGSRLTAIRDKLPRGTLMSQGLDDQVILAKGAHITLQDTTGAASRCVSDLVLCFDPWTHSGCMLLCDLERRLISGTRRGTTYIEVHKAGSVLAHMLSLTIDSTNESCGVNIAGDQPAVALRVFKYAIGKGTL